MEQEYLTPAVEETTGEPTEERRPLPRRARRAIVAGLWVLSLLLTAVGVFLFTRYAVPTEAETLSEALSIIRKSYFYYDAKQDQLVDGAIAGMADSLGDVYSRYYTEEEYAALNQSNSGYYVGLGITVLSHGTGSFEITTVLADGPAEKAGVQVGDWLRAINGVSAEDQELGAFLSNVKTENGAENTLVLERDGQTLTISVVAEQVYVPTVAYRMQTDTIGYIRLSGFHGECVTEMKEAIEDLREQGMQSLILDIRGNLGGSLYDALDIADLFLSKDLIITSLRSREETTVEYKTKTAGYVFPLVLLVNGRSASASELVTGALKDHGRAYVIGTQTYGKGIVQTYLPVTGTGGYIKLTTEAYYTPSGVCIQGVGITPNEVVENPPESDGYSPENIPFEIDLQLQAAIAYLMQSA